MFFLVSLFALIVLLLSELLYLSFFKSDSKEVGVAKQRVVKVAHYSNLNAAIRAQ